MVSLTLQFVPYSDIESLSTQERISKLIDIVKHKSVVLMEGRLKPEEETKLIQKTMREINKSFKGIELCTIYPEDRNLDFFKKVRKNFTSAILGDREGLTIIGPASVVKEIRRDPEKIHLFTFDIKKR